MNRPRSSPNGQPSCRVDAVEEGQMKSGNTNKLNPRNGLGSRGETYVGPGRKRFSAGLFGIKANRTTVGQEVLAGVIGWQTVASSFESYATLFNADEEGKDTGATFGAFLLVAGLSTLTFGVIFNLPFIIAPSILYTTRSPGTTVGGHLAAQAIASVAAALFLALTLRISLMSRIPTALRLGAGCGISLLVGVLGMRGVGLLATDSFALEPFTWQSCIGLGIIAAACCRATRTNRTRKWMYILFVPMVVTTLVYAAVDPSKFQGCCSAGSRGLYSWRTATFGTIDFSEIREHQKLYWLYTIRTFLSVVINIPSVLLVLIDGVRLEAAHTGQIPLGKASCPDAVGGVQKFNLHHMACTIQLMSCAGNFMGVTTQAAFVESMILTFAGGATGLSSAVTGALLIISVGLRPAIPVLVTPHVSGALAVVMMLRYFRAIRMIDTSQTSNLLLFGMSLMLIPFSFDFATVVCIAVMLGFTSETVEKVVFRLGAGSSDVSGGATVVPFGEGKDEPDHEAGETTGFEEPSAKAGLWNNTPIERARRYTAPSISPSRATGSEKPGSINAEARHPQRPLLSRLHSRVSRDRRESARRKSSYRAARQPPPSVRAEGSTPLPRPPSVHWSLALIASLQLVLSAVLGGSEGD